MFVSAPTDLRSRVGLDGAGHLRRGQAAGERAARTERTSSSDGSAFARLPMVRMASESSGLGADADAP